MPAQLVLVPPVPDSTQLDLFPGAAYDKPPPTFDELCPPRVPSDGDGTVARDAQASAG